ncbi:serine hydrolase domain-containing protein [Flindersiella endophytica]
MNAGWNPLVAQARTNQTAALAVATGGGAVLEWYDDNGMRAIECMSVTKFVVAMALGLALSADDLRAPLRRWIDEWAHDVRGDLTLTQVLTHRTGLAVGSPATVYQAASVRSLVLASEPATEPGRFAYNNVAFHLAGIVAERAGGRTVDELAGDGLFAPLDVRDWSWQRDPEGFPLCMSGLCLRAADLARLGSLHLNHGRCGSRLLLPPWWLAAQPPGRGELGLGCFAQFTRPGDPRSRIGFGHDGYLGQWISVQPAAGVVAVRMRTVDVPDPAYGWATFPTDVDAVVGPRIV